MGLPDKHDARPGGFLHYAQFDSNGSVVAIVERHVTTGPPEESVGSFYVEITDKYPYQLDGVTITKKIVTDKDRRAAKLALFPVKPDVGPV